MKRTTALTAVAALLLSLLLIGAAPPQHAGSEMTRVIVTFDDEVAAGAAAQGLARRFGGEVVHVYEHALHGATVELPGSAVSGLSRVPGVRQVELEQPMFLLDAGPALATQSGATWGLDRIDQRALPLDTEYAYPASAGEGVTVYIVDSGVLGTHPEFKGRLGDGYSAVTATDSQDPNADCSGHGTHVAGTAAGATYGVAKAATIESVRVFNCAGSGTSTDVIRGIDWIIKNNTAPAVANFSLGFMGIVASVDTAIKNLVGAGVNVAVAAGNGNRGGRAQDACDYSPARVSEALTVSATTSSDQRPSWANYGACVQVFAPGASITSAWNDGATKRISGTSMASPHVAGVAALLLGEAPDATTGNIRSDLLRFATPDVVANPGPASPNLLVHSLPVAPADDADDGDGPGDGLDPGEDGAPDDGGSGGDDATDDGVQPPSAISVDVVVREVRQRGPWTDWAATIGVADADPEHGGPLSGALVEGVWSTQTSAACTTVDGSCSVEERVRSGELTFEVATVTVGTVIYEQDESGAWVGS